MKIKDPALKNYQIDFDGVTYILEKVGTNKVTKVETIVNMGYFTSLPVLIGRVAGLLISQKDQTLTLQEFITEFRNISKEITENLKV